MKKLQEQEPEEVYSLFDETIKSARREAELKFNKVETPKLNEADKLNNLAAHSTALLVNKFISTSIFDKDKDRIVSVGFVGGESMKRALFRINTKIGNSEFINIDELFSLIKDGGFENEDKDRTLYIVK